MHQNTREHLLAKHRRTTAAAWNGVQLFGSQAQKLRDRIEDDVPVLEDIEQLLSDSDIQASHRLILKAESRGLSRYLIGYEVRQILADAAQEPLSLVDVWVRGESADEIVVSVLDRDSDALARKILTGKGYAVTSADATKLVTVYAQPTPEF